MFFTTAKCPGMFWEKVFLRVDSFRNEGKEQRIGSAVTAKLVKSALTCLALSSGDQQNLLYKKIEHQFNHNFPFLFIAGMNKLNVDKCILLHRTKCVLEINKRWLKTVLPIPVPQQYFSSNVDSSQFQYCSSKSFLRQRKLWSIF